VGQFGDIADKVNQEIAQKSPGHLYTTTIAETLDVLQGIPELEKKKLDNQ
jgi:hypothetical protein